MFRKAFFIITTIVLILAVFTGIVSALDVRETVVVKNNLENVRSFAVASHAAGVNYAIDNGQLYAGRPGEWRLVRTPEKVIVASVAADTARPGTIFAGAANELAIYHSTDSGKHWQRVPLSKEFVGGVISLAVDSANRLVYAGTDTAGVFRLRDVGSSLIAGGHQLFDEPVVQVAADSTSAGLAFVRTALNLYRAENGGLNWVKVENLGSAPTAMTVVNSLPATVLVGTSDRGVLSSRDGQTWTLLNDGLGMVPGARLHVDALANDPAQLDVIYVATSYLYGTSEAHLSPVGVAMSTNGGASWTTLVADKANVVVALAPVAGQTGAAYALTLASRTPQALGSAPVFAPQVVEPALAGNPAAPDMMAWIVAGLAAMALLFAFTADAMRRSQQPTHALVQSRMIGQGR